VPNMEVDKDQSKFFASWDPHRRCRRDQAPQTWPSTVVAASRAENRLWTGWAPDGHRTGTGPGATGLTGRPLALVHTREQGKKMRQEERKGRQEHLKHLKI
ncbi:unnamed protein product, partial [Effrenium voratum]